MSPDKFDDRELERERWFKSELGAQLQRFIDDKRAPHEYLITEDADEDDVIDLQSMSIAPFVARDEDHEF